MPSPIEAMDQLLASFCETIDTGSDSYWSFFERALRNLEDPLVEAFRTSVNSFDDYETANLWDCWIRWKARANWYRKGAPSDQSHERQVDDYMEGKRFLAYLLADHILATQKRCPIAGMTGAKAKYLASLSLDEYVRYKAYFLYRKDKASKVSRHADHYAQALAEVHELVREWSDASCGDKMCRTKLDSLDLAGQFNAPNYEALVRFITNAKQHALARLRVQSDVWEMVYACVDRFYHWLLLERPGEPSPTEPLQTMFRHSSAINMFELFVMCPLQHCRGGPELEPLRVRSSARGLVEPNALTARR